MGPFRLIIIAILLYIGYRLLTSGRKKEKKTGKQDTVSGNAGPVSDVLVEDPVCHCLVPKGQAIRLQHNSKMLYFCSEDCCNKFIEEEKDT
jgi:YHS domain-containing protein